MLTKFQLAGSLLLGLVLFSFIPPAVLAQDNANQFEAVEPGVTAPEEFFRAEVLEKTTREQEVAPGFWQESEVYRLRLLGGDRDGQVVEAESFGQMDESGATDYQPGDRVVVGLVSNLDEPFYYIADRYRLTPLIIILILFFGSALLFGRWRGLTSLLGLSVSILILATFVVPQIVAGRNPLLITLVGAFTIAALAMYLAHGFSRRTSVALAGTLITLTLATVLAVVFVSFGKLFGLGSEEAFYLQFAPGLAVNLRGLLLGGIIIGTLGVLDDVTASQAAVVDELGKANPSLAAAELYRRGLAVGHEHIAALINTLALAYAGASLPLFILFTLNHQPLWVILNSELVAEEVIRTLAGSLALILAVPITTGLAAYFLSRRRAPKS